MLQAAALPLLIRPARAATTRLRIARQFGIGYAQMALLEDQKLIEKFAADAGLGNIEVTWSTFRSSDVMNDALLSGGIDIASLGVPGLATIWDRTAGARFEVKGLVGLNIAPLALVTRDASIRTIADYKPGMKIALPAAKVSNQAIFLQMAAAKQWGPAEFARLDPLTVSMSHPDAVVALLSGSSEITSYFGSPPFTQRAMKVPGIHEVMNSAELLGAPASFNILGTPTRFHEQNPALIKAFVDALAAATAAINADRPKAAATYARMTGDKTPVEELVDVMTTGITYTLDIQGTLPIVQFMNATGVLKHRPQAWTDYMLPTAASYGGS
jgi:NitT/TauT family transport system substrate-binding protein